MLYPPPRTHTHTHTHTHVYIEALKYIRIYPRSGMIIYWTHFSAFLCSMSLEISFIKSCRGCWQSETKISSDAISDARLRMNLLTNTLTYKHTHTHTHTHNMYMLCMHTLPPVTCGKSLSGLCCPRVFGDILPLYFPARDRPLRAGFSFRSRCPAESNR